MPCRLMLPLTGKEQTLLDLRARHPDARSHHFVIERSPSDLAKVRAMSARLALYRRLRFGVQGSFDVVAVGAKEAD